MRNLINKVFFNFFVMGIFFQSCDQKTILPVPTSEETVEVVSADVEDFGYHMIPMDPSIQEFHIQKEPYHDDPYFYYVQEYRYKNNVYTYEDKEKHVELANLLDSENITVVFAKDLNEVSEYEAKHANIAIEERDFSLAPIDKIVHLFDTEQESEDFLKDYDQQIDVIQGNIEERATCYLPRYNVRFRLYKHYNFGGGSPVIFDIAGNANLSFVRNIPGWMNDRISSFKIKFRELPSSTYTTYPLDTPVIQFFNNYNGNHNEGWCWYQYYNRCATFWGEDSSIHYNCNDKVSSIRIYMIQ